MSSLKVYSMEGAAQGEITIEDDLIETKRGAQVVHDVVVAYRAAQRAGTASTLSKGEVAGTGAKPWRQKGTGRARAGYRQSPIWRGGAVAFGPKPRDYRKKVNRKVARLAFRRSLSDKIESGALRVIDKLEVSEPKTKTIVALLHALDIRGPVLLILDTVDKNISLSARNIKSLELATAHTVNTYQIVRYPVIIVASGAIETLKARMGGKKAEQS